MTTDGSESALIRSISERPHARLGALAPELIELGLAARPARGTAVVVTGGGQSA